MNSETQQEVPQGQVEQPKKPVKTYTCKGGVQATVWSDIKEFDGKRVEFFNVTIERRYLIKDGNSANNEDWKATNSMRAEDLPKVSLVCDQAFKYIVMKQIGN